MSADGVIALMDARAQGLDVEYGEEGGGAAQLLKNMLESVGMDGEFAKVANENFTVEDMSHFISGVTLGIILAERKAAQS